GIHCTIIRLPILGGNSESGVIALQRYWFTQALRAMWLMKAVPAFPEPLQVVPVDYAAKVIVGLSQSKAPSGSAFHLTHPAGVSVEDVHLAFAELGRASRRVSIEEWTALVSARSEESQDEELEYLSSFLLGANVAARAAEAAVKHLRFDRSNLERALGPHLPALPPAPEMVRRVLTFLQRNTQLDRHS
ncbi:MAG TPA: hypothetical protein VJU61_08120, partial [Polyangiaceae bacterium]|nr:hypothetical protein [Polyangiaceae bacterium]